MLKYSKALQSAQPGLTADKVTVTKVYGRLQCDKTMSLEEVSEHMAAHNTPFSSGAIFGILKDLVGCMRHLLLDGNSIQLGDLGRFYLSIKTDGAASFEDFTTDNIKEVNLNFDPGKKFENMRQDAEFKQVISRAAQSEGLKEVNGGGSQENPGGGAGGGGMESE